MLLPCRSDYSGIVTSFNQLPCYLISPHTEWLQHGGSIRVVVVAW
jgi:hypothetical protein